MDNLTKDEQQVLDKYRKAKEMVHASLEVVLQVHVQDGVLIHMNLTEKSRPMPVGATRLKEV